MPAITIVPTGTANMASVKAAFARLGVETRLAESAGAIEQASHVMLPGVGAFGASMARLREQGFDKPLKARMLADRPTMAICVGHQLLFASSEESPGVDGLGLVDAHVGAFEADVRAPQFGWNEVTAREDAQVLDCGFAYFANSFRALEAPGWQVARALHGQRFVAAMERGNVVGCQFHPELSADYGAAILSRFMELGQ